MSNKISKVDQFDIEKIHNEINQLRNHQFLICISALTFFGAFIVWYFPENSHNKDELPLEILDLLILATIFLQLIFLALYWWLSQLSKMIVRLASYLRANNFSNWEDRYWIHINKKNQSMKINQRKTMGIVFLILGIITTTIPYAFHFFEIYSFSQKKFISEFCWRTASSIFFAFYCFFIILSGRNNGKKIIENELDSWKETLTQKKGEAKKPNSHPTENIINCTLKTALFFLLFLLI